MKKKIFAILICIVVVICTSPLTATAEKSETVVSEPLDVTAPDVIEPAIDAESVEEGPNTMRVLLLCFLCVWGYRLATNVSGLLRLNHYDREYSLYLSNPEKNFAENTGPLVQLFKAAGVADRQIPYVEPMGYGQLLQGHTLLFSNIGNLRDSVVANMIACFAEAKGVYKHRILENFSPLFWIRSILFLPRTLLAYLGVKGDSLITKLFQLLYWLVMPFLVAFRENLYQYIVSLIS